MLEDSGGSDFYSSLKYDSSVGAARPVYDTLAK